MNVIVDALDTLGLALVEHGHVWTARQRQLYERAISLSRKGSDLSASGKDRSRSPYPAQQPVFDRDGGRPHV